MRHAVATLSPRCLPSHWHHHSLIIHPHAHLPNNLKFDTIGQHHAVHGRIFIKTRIPATKSNVCTDHRVGDCGSTLRRPRGRGGNDNDFIKKVEGTRSSVDVELCAVFVLIKRWEGGQQSSMSRVEMTTWPERWLRASVQCRGHSGAPSVTQHTQHSWTSVCVVV